MKGKTAVAVLAGYLIARNEEHVKAFIGDVARLAGQVAKDEAVQRQVRGLLNELLHTILEDAPLRKDTIDTTFKEKPNP